MNAILCQPVPTWPRLMWRRYLGALALGAAVADMCGCGSLQPNAGTLPQVRFIAASANSPGFDFYAGPAAVVYNQGFGTPSSYLPLPAGETRFRAVAATASQTLVSATGDLLTSHNYTILVGNTMGALTETLVEDRTAPAPAGEVEFRFLDQVTRLGAVDVYLRSPSGKLTGSTPVAAGLGLNGNSGYLTVPAGTYAVVVLPAGTVPSAASVPLYTGALEPYESGAVTTAVLIDGSVPAAPALGAILASDVDPSTSIP